MAHLSKILVCFVLLAFLSADSFADRGGLGKHRKEAIGLNIKTAGSFKSNINFNLTTGLKYTGSLVNVNAKSTPAHPLIIANNAYNSAYTFKKGNNIYYMPYKAKRIVADVKPGYSGVKMVIKVP